MLERNLDCWGEKTSDRADRRHKQKRRRQDEAETSSSSSSSSSSSDRKRQKRKRKKEKKEKKKAKKGKKEKKAKKEKARKDRKADDRADADSRDTQLPTVYAPPPPDVAEEVPLPTPASCSLPGAMRPQQAEAERVAGQRIVKVWDPSLGVERSVRANGEVVEQCVSAACLSRSPARARVKVARAPARRRHGIAGSAAASPSVPPARRLPMQLFAKLVTSASAVMKRAAPAL